MEKINFNSFFKKRYDQISICACDAGASEHISAWTKNLDTKINYCLDGPAVRIFQRDHKKINNLDIEECLNNSNIHIAGTGWSSTLEIYSTKLAKEKSIYTISVLDHWVSYKERFIYQNELILPDEIWVSDELAKEIAKKDFPNIKISTLPNIWMENLKAKFNYFSNGVKNIKNKPAQNLLYLLEPIRYAKQWHTKHNEICEFDALRNFIEKISILQKFSLIDKNINKINLRLRLHPSEENKKYNLFLSKLKLGINYSISNSQTLEEDLAWCDIALGIETQALISAMSCGIISLTTKPKWAGRCCLPHKNLVHLSDLV